MIDYLTFIDELKAIKNANDTIESKKRVSGIISVFNRFQFVYKC